MGENFDLIKIEEKEKKEILLKNLEIKLLKEKNRELELRAEILKIKGSIIKQNENIIILALIILLIIVLVIIF